MSDPLNPLATQEDAFERAFSRVQTDSVNVMGADPTQSARRQRIRKNAIAMTQVTPEKMQRAVNVSKERSLLPEAALLDLENAEQRNRIETVTKLIEGNEALTRFAQDPKNVALTHDDMEKLNRVSTLFQSINLERDREEEQGGFEFNILTPVKEAWSLLSTGFGDFSVMEKRSLQLETYKRIDAAHKEMGRPFKNGAEFRKWARENEIPGGAMAAGWSYNLSDPAKRKEMQSRDEAAVMRNAMEASRSSFEINRFAQDEEFNDIVANGTAGDVIGAIFEKPSRLLRLVAQGYTTSAPSLAASFGAGAATGSAGSAPGMIVGGTVAALGSFATEQALGVKGGLERRGIDTTDPNALLQAFQDPELVQELREETTNKALGVSAVDAIALIAGRGLIPRNIGRMQLSPNVQAMANRFAQVPAQGAFEAGGEALGQQMAFGEIDLNEVVLEGLAGMGAGEAVIGSASHALDRYRNRDSAIRAVEKQRKRLDNTTETLLSLADEVAQTKTAQRSPEAMTALLSEAKKGTDLETVMVAPEGVRELFQTRNEEDDFYRSVGVEPSEMADLANTGEYVEIRVEKLLALENASEVIQSLSADIKTSRDELTAREMEMVERLDDDQINALFQTQTMTTEPVADATGEDVRAAVARQLEAAGVAKREARANATLWKSTMEALGQRTGQTAFEVFEQARLRVARGASPAAGELKSGTLGSTEITENGDRIIRLFAGANRSTFAHESAHVFFDVMQDLAGSPEGADLVADMDALRKWTGMDDLSSVEAQEKFAEGFEQYLMEGKAPSKDLRAVFAMFKRWLTEIYKGLTTNVGVMNVELTPEIRELMDRMVASEDAIDNAVKGRQLAPSLRRVAADELGLTGPQQDRLDRLFATAQTEARETLLKSLMADIRVRRTEEYRDALQAAEDDIASELAGAPTWRLLTYMREGRDIREGDAVGTDVDEVVKIDRKAFVDQFGLDRLKGLPGGTTKTGLTSTKGGITPDVAAELFGFSSAVDMLQGIEQLRREDGRFRTFDETVEAAAADRVASDMEVALDEERIRKEAEKALHNAPHGQLIATELQILRRLGAEDILATGQRKVVDKEGSKEAGRNAPETGDAAGDVLAADAQTQAVKEGKRREASGRARAREAMRPLPTAVIREAARRKVSGMTIADMGKVHKLAADERRAARKAEAAIAGRDYSKAALYKWQQLWNHYTILEANKAQDRVRSINKRIKSLEKRKPNSRNMDVHYLAKAKELIALYGGAPNPQKVAEIQLWVDQQNTTIGPTGGPAAIVLDPVVFDNVGKGEQLTFDGLVKLDEALRSITTNGIANSRAQDAQFKALVNDLTQQIYTTQKVKDRPEYRTMAGKLREGIVENFLGGHRKVEHLLRAFDGYEDQGPTWQAVFRPINEASTQETTMRAEASVAFKELWAKLDKPRGFWTAKHKFPGIGTLTKQEIIAVALNWGNEGNRQTVTNQGRGWERTAVEAMLATLSDDEWSFVEGVWSMIDSYWPQIAAMEQRISGVAPKKVQADPFIMNGRQIQGGYYPIKFDPKRSDKTSRRETTDAKSLETMAGANTRAQTKHGHTQERATQNAQPLWLSLNAIPSHIDAVIHDLTHREPVLQAARILRSKEFAQAVNETHGQPMNKFLDGWLKEIAAGKIHEVEVADAILRHARIGMSAAEMGFSLRTALVQPMGLTQSIAEIGAGPTMAGVGAFFKNPQTAKKMVDELSPEMSNRSRQFDREVADASREALPQSLLPGFLGMSADGLRGLRNAAFSLIAYMDMGVAYPTWIGAYEKKLAAGEAQQTAIDYANQVVRMTQSSGLAKDLASVQRGSEAARLFTGFYTFFASFHNMTVDAVERTGIKAKEQGIAPASIYAAGQFFWLVFFPALVSKAVLDGGPEDSDEWDSWAVSTLAQYMGSGTIITRDIVSAMTSDFGYSGPASTRVFGEFVNLATQAGQGELDKSLARSATMSIGYAFHLPARQIWRTMEAFAEHDSAVEVAAGVAGLRHFKDK